MMKLHRVFAVALALAISIASPFAGTVQAHHPSYCGHGTSSIYYSGGFESQDIYVTFQNIDGSHLHKYNHYQFFYDGSGNRIGQFAHSFWKTC